MGMGGSTVAHESVGGWKTVLIGGSLPAGPREDFQDFRNGAGLHSLPVIGDQKNGPTSGIVQSWYLNGVSGLV